MICTNQARICKVVSQQQGASLCRNAAYLQGSLISRVTAVCNLLLQAGCGRPTPISDAACCGTLTCVGSSSIRQMSGEFDD
jgi:hypothetical protein